MFENFVDKNPVQGNSHRKKPNCVLYNPPLDLAAEIGHFGDFKIIVENSAHRFRNPTSGRCSIWSSDKPQVFENPVDKNPVQGNSHRKKPNCVVYNPPLH